MPYSALWEPWLCNTLLAMAGIPQPKTNEIVAQLQLVINTGEFPDDLTWHRIKRDSRALRDRADPVSGNVCLAMIAGLEWNKPELDAAARRAVQLENHDAHVHLNIALAYSQMAALSEAAEHAYSAYEVFQSVDFSGAKPTDITDIVSSLYFAGHVAKANEVKEALETYTQRDLGVGVFAVNSMMEELGVTEERLRHEIDAATELLRERQYRMRRASFYPLRHEDGARTIEYELEVRCPSNEIIPLTLAYVDRIGDSDDWDPSVFNLSFTARNTHEEADADSEEFA